MEEGYPKVLGGKVEDIMSKNPMTVGHTIYFGSRLVHGPQNFRRMPVVDKGCSLG